MTAKWVDPWPEIEDVGPKSPYDDWDQNEFPMDEMTCPECGRSIGPGLHDEDGYDVSHWIGTFKFAGVVYCEDCAIDHAQAARDAGGNIERSDHLDFGPALCVIIKLTEEREVKQ